MDLLEHLLERFLAEIGGGDAAAFVAWAAKDLGRIPLVSAEIEVGRIVLRRAEPGPTLELPLGVESTSMPFQSLLSGGGVPVFGSLRQLDGAPPPVPTVDVFGGRGRP